MIKCGLWNIQSLSSKPIHQWFDNVVKDVLCADWKRPAHLDDTDLVRLHHHLPKLCGDQDLTLLGDWRDKQTGESHRGKKMGGRGVAEDWAIIVLVINDGEKTSTALFLTNQKVSIWVVEAPGTEGTKCISYFFFVVVCLLICDKYIYLLHDGVHLHTNTYSPVNHGSVASVHVDANAIARSGIPRTTDSVQTLQDKNGDNPNQETIIYIYKNIFLKGFKLTATKSTFFSVGLGMVKGSHRSCERNLRVRNITSGINTDNLKESIQKLCQAGSSIFPVFILSQDNSWIKLSEASARLAVSLNTFLKRARGYYKWAGTPPVQPWYTWLGSGSTSSQFSDRFPHGAAVKGLCLTDGRMR